MKKYFKKILNKLYERLTGIGVCKHENRTWIRGFGDQCIDCGKKLYIKQ